MTTITFAQLVILAKLFLEKYKVQIHIFQLLWNSFVTSWATGLSVPLSEFGLPFSLNGRATVTWLQTYAHMPTWIVGILTFLINATLFYMNWKKSHVNIVTVPEGSVLIAAPPNANAKQDGETTKVQVQTNDLAGKSEK